MVDDIWAQKAQAIVDRHDHMIVTENTRSAIKVEITRELRAAAAGAGERMRERAAGWHDDRYRNTPDVFEMEFHDVSRKAIRALPLDEERTDG